MDCDNIGGYFFEGNQIFSSQEMLKLTSLLTMSGWIFLRGYENKYYTIFSIIEGSDIPLSLSYNLDIQTFKMKSFTSESSAFLPRIVKNEWIFFFSTINYETKFNSIKANTYIYKNLAQSPLPVITQSIRQSYFQKDLIKINIGIPSNIMNIEPSCSFIKNFVLHWDVDIQPSQIGSLINDISSISSEILWNFDFFYTKNNPGYVLSSYENKINKLNLSSDSQIDNIMNGGEFFNTDYINVSEQNGLTLSFDLYLESTMNQQIQNIVKIQFYDQSYINILTLQNNKIQVVQYTSTGQQFTMIANGIEKVWVNIRIVMKNGLLDKSFVLIDTMNSSQQTVIMPLGYTSPLAYIQFGKTSNQRIFKLNNIIIMKGTLFQSNNSCQYQIRNIKNYQECILCNHLESTDMENGMSCLPTTSVNLDNESYYRKKWLRQNCNKNMIFKQGQCVCSDQFYEKNGKCIRCPYHCNGCLDHFTCKKIAEFRGQNGSCLIDKFDDGFSCIDEQKSNTLNKIQVVKFDYFNSNIICNQQIDSSFQYTFKSNQLNYSGQQPLLYSFSFLLTYTTISKGIISVVSDSNNGEIFTILYDNKYIVLYLLGSQQIKLQINTKESFIVSIWTNWQILIMIVYTNSQILQKDILFNLSQPILDIKICVGPCKSNYYNKYQCGHLSDRPFTFIKNIGYNQIKSIPINKYLIQMKQYPIQNDIIGQIVAQDLIRLALFKSELTKSNPDQFLFDNLNYFNFKNTLSYTNEDIGFYITKQTSAEIYLSSPISFPFTISMYLYIYEIRKSSILIQYQMNGYQIIYQLVPINMNTVFIIRICVDSLCQDANYAKLYNNQPNHLMIIPMNKSIYSQEIYFFQFEIVCNYMRESLSFVNKLKYISPTQQIKFGDAKQLDEIRMYINKVQIYNGNGGVSFNTDNSDKCFIYSNIEQNNCLYPKKGFLLFQQDKNINKEISITVEECYKLNELQNNGIYTFTINLYINECLKICKHPYTNLKKNCECIDGYFSEITSDGQTICIKCDDKCQTCKGTKDNCLTCTLPDLFTPNCICNSANSYLDLQTNTCLSCSFKCESCIENQDNCLICSENRINPPFCNCDERYYKQDGDNCTKIECNQKCEKCENTTDNCTICKLGRHSPPDCFCQENYKESINGECTPCPINTYYEPLSNNCLPCNKPCQECIKNQDICTSCIDGFLYSNFECLCLNGKNGQQVDNGKFVCINDFDVSVDLLNKGNYYEFTMNFTQLIQEIPELNENNPNDILDLYIPQINKKYYTLIDFIFNSKQISFKLQVKQNFSANEVILTILQTDVFKSLDSLSGLAQRYKNLPFNFQIGPNVFTEDILNNENMDNTINFLKNQNSQELKILQQLQLVLYLLNTVQPSSLFLLLQVQLPPNLYKFCQIFGLLIFPTVSDYKSLQIQDQYNVFGLDLNEKEVYPDCWLAFSRLGFSNSLLINIPIIVIKYATIFILIGIIKITTLACFPRINISLLIKVKTILIKRLNTENEINLLLTSLSILLQFRCIDENSYASRYGLYLAIGFLAYLIAINIFNYRLINQNNQQEIDQVGYTILFTERILPTENSKYKRNYFFIQLLKKYIQIAIIFLFYPFPYIVATLCGVLLLLSSISTMILQPYKNLRSRIIKTFGELLLSLCWFLCLFFPQIENQFSKNNIIENNLFQKYIKNGTIIIYLIITFNILFIIEFIIQTIQSIARLLSKKSEQIQQQQITLFKIDKSQYILSK